MKKFIYLNYIEQLKRRIDAHSDLVQVLIGPRQVGKTTSVLKLIEDHYKNKAHYASADRVFNSRAEWITEQWLKAEAEEKILFIDEIQKCENWSEVVKHLFDKAKRNKRKIRCVLLGSSSLDLQKGLTDSLTGRFQLTRAFHWNYQESKKAYDLTFEDYQIFGGYPGSYPLIPSGEWSDYVKNSIVSTVIEKDILQYQNVKSPSLFRQAFEILMNHPAQEISYTKLLGQLQERGNVEVIKNYIHLYEGAFLLKSLEKFSMNKIKLKGSSPKILPLAPCFYFLTTMSQPNQEDRGRILELMVGAQLVRTGLDLFYWREGTHEVDYVLQRGRQIWGIEVKSGRKKSTRGLMAFSAKFPKSETRIIDRNNYFEFEESPLEFLEKSSKKGSPSS